MGASARANECFLAWARFHGDYGFDSYRATAPKLAAPKGAETRQEWIARATALLRAPWPKGGAASPILGRRQRLTAAQIAAIELVGNLRPDADHPQATIALMLKTLNDAFGDPRAAQILLANGVGLRHWHWSAFGTAEALLAVNAPSWVIADAIEEGLLGSGAGHELAGQQIREAALEDPARLNLSPGDDGYRARQFWQGTDIAKQWDKLGGHPYSTRDGYPVYEFNAATLLAAARRDGKLPPIHHLRLKGVRAEELRELAPYLKGTDYLELGDIESNVLAAVPEGIRSLAVKFDRDARPNPQAFRDLFARVKNLESLDLTDNESRFLSFENLPTSLRVLKLNRIRAAGNSRAPGAAELDRDRLVAELRTSLPKLKKLEAIDFNAGCVSHQVFDAIPATVRDIGLFATHDIDAAAMSALLKRLTNLRHLNASDTGLPFHVFRDLSPSVVTLQADGSNTEGLTAKDQAEILARLTGLRNLSLTGALTDGTVLAHLPTGLRSLDIAWNKVSNAQLGAILPQLTALAHLDIGATQIDGSILKQLPPSIETLTVTGLSGEDGGGKITERQLRNWVTSARAPRLRHVSAVGIDGDGKPWPWADALAPRVTFFHRTEPRR